MRRISTLPAAGWLVAMLVACGGGAPASPGTGGPGLTDAPSPSAAPAQTTLAPAEPTAATTQDPPTTTGSGAGDTCAGKPTVDPGASLTPDDDLASRFPPQVDGQPVTGLETFRWSDFICAVAGQAALDAWEREIPERFQAVLSSLSYGSADVTVDGGSVEISAFRAAGLDGSILQALHGELSQMASGEMPAGQSSSVSSLQLGGKDVTAWTDESGEVTHLYPSGDILFRVRGASESQAAKVFAVLP